MCSRPEDPDPGARGARDERLADARRHHRAVRPRTGPHRATRSSTARPTAAGGTDPVWSLFVGGCVALAVAILLSPGFFTLQPNEARVLILFGAYKGTCKQGGFRWGNPFYANGPAGQGSGAQTAVDRGARRDAGDEQAPDRSQEAQALQGQPARPHAERRPASRSTTSAATPSTSPPWWCGASRTPPRPSSTSTTSRRYVATQSETAVRHLASAYPYDSGETFADTEDEITLRGNVDEVSEALRVELTERLGQAGVDRRAGPAHATSPTPRRSPRRCSAASRPRPSSPRAARSSPAR